MTTLAKIVQEVPILPVRLAQRLTFEPFQRLHAHAIPATTMLGSPDALSVAMHARDVSPARPTAWLVTPATTVHLQEVVVHATRGTSIPLSRCAQLATTTV